MKQRRIYNPAQLSPEELKASFVARQETLTEMLRLLDEQKTDRPCQHMLLVGSRGMGKTTLGLRFLQAVRETPDLAEAWQPVAFHEESYQVTDLADFWLTALHHLTRATRDSRWEDKAEALSADEKDPQRLAAYALSVLIDFSRESGKRLILFVENLDIVFSQLGDEREVHALRAALIEHPEILLIGSANAVFEAIQHRGEPFYEFFRVFLLEGLGREEYLQIFRALAERECKTKIAETLSRERGRIETMRRLTGGNPRLLVLTYGILVESPLGSAFKDLEQLIDEQTPYFKSRIEELPTQSRKVFHCLAEGWSPMLAKEVSAAARLSSSHTSAQLKQLVDKGYAREARPEREKRIRYEVADRFYNIYFLLRFSRRGYRRLKLLVDFLNDLFGPVPMRSMYLATLEKLSSGVSKDEEAPELLGALIPYAANDSDFAEREDWMKKAFSLIINSIGANVSAFGEIVRDLSRHYQLGLDCFSDKVCRGIELLQSERFVEAETECRGAIRREPDNLFAWVLLGSALRGRRHFEDALDAFRHVTEAVGPDDPAQLQICALGALTGEAGVLLALENSGDVLSVIAKIWELVNQDDPHPLRYVATELIRVHGKLLLEADHHEEALAIWRQVSQYVCPEDPELLRLTFLKTLAERGNALVAQKRYDEAVSILENFTQYVRTDDSITLRYGAGLALFALDTAYLELGRFEDWIISCDRFSEYVYVDDPVDTRRKFARLLATKSNIANSLGYYDDSESGCKKAVELDPECGEAWRVRAEAILGGDEAARLEEAKRYACRAAELMPEDPAAFHAVSDVLARCGNWMAALEKLDRALSVAVGQQCWNTHGLTESLINLAAAGWSQQVMQIMESHPALTETMEPLWHAVRAETGEELESLPAEITQAVIDIRKRFSEKKKMLPKTTPLSI
ncbi:MAG: AAA family ATPase [Candidatus Dadabacteria bacterium]|nr:AAA family ATPase [Candidatus Dadabacteria bacterium]MDE0519681.1 AAA family ATPase [Candidatus Dadabacteria bacterium]MDE0663399.1 AAA family ATPase [Candidatus Dadabacteria bacterium]